MKPRAPQNNEKYRLLVIGSSADEARLALGSLTAAGLECRHAQDGDSAMALLRAVNPHLVFLDLDTMGAGGQQVLAAIRATGEVPIMVAALSGDTASEMQSFKAGADDYVAKPFNVKLLVARVVSQLRRCYIYDRCADTDEETLFGSDAPSGDSATAVPTGWAMCESCSYMGPRARFEHEDALGKRTLLCPNCKQSEYVVFALG